MGRYNQYSQCTDLDNGQAVVKFYWRKEQEPDQYRVYRDDGNSGDRRSEDEICQQELKNAVCITCSGGARPEIWKKDRRECSG